MALYDRYFAIGSTSGDINTRNILSDFWDELGPLLIAPYLDSSSIARLAVTQKQLCQSACIGKSWLIPVEVTPALRSSCAMRAHYVGRECDAHVPLVEVTLPNKSLFEGLPGHLAKQAVKCQELVFDFAPVSYYQDQCSHTSVLTEDPWQHVVLRLLLSAALLDRTMQIIHDGFPNLQILRLTNMPSLSLGKQVVQDDNGEEPLAFLVLKELAHCKRLRALFFKSTRWHPNSISFISRRALEKLVDTVLPSLALEQLSLATFMVQPDYQPRRSVSEYQDVHPMPLMPFLQLRGLRHLHLGAIRYQQNGGPVMLDLTGTPQLQELHISFYISHGDELVGGVGVKDTQLMPLSPSLQQLSLKGLGAGQKGLRSQLAGCIATCPRLEKIELSGPQLQVDFFNELASFLDTAVVGPPSRCWSLEWTWMDTGPSEVDQAVLQRLEASLHRCGCELQLKTDKRKRPDLRMTCESMARLEQKATAGLDTFGKGMEWFLGGRPPGDLSVEQRAVINNRYVAE